jgi:hypothetical protein
MVNAQRGGCAGKIARLQAPPNVVARLELAARPAPVYSDLEIIQPIAGNHFAIYDDFVVSLHERTNEDVGGRHVLEVVSSVRRSEYVKAL